MPEQRFNYLEEKEAGKKVREFGSFPFKKKKNQQSVMLTRKQAMKEKLFVVDRNI